MLACLKLSQAWVSHTSDPLISPDAQAVIAAIASHPACLPSLAAAAAPTLAGILSSGAAARQAKRHGLQPPPAAAAAGGGDEAPMLVEASLDLLGTLLQPNQPALANEVRMLKCHRNGLCMLIAYNDIDSKSCCKLASQQQVVNV
jgi:hypothetical protein